VSGWVVYLLRCGDGSLYCGTTNDLDRRIAAHAGGTGAKYTRGRGPVELAAWAACADKSAALKAERAVKGQRTPAAKLACLAALAAQAEPPGPSDRETAPPK
jgi:predicted GIY-YIG superfamily endonuclease